MVKFFKCKNCGFTCCSQKLFDMHLQREESGLTEKEERTAIAEKLKEIHLEKVNKHWQ